MSWAYLFAAILFEVAGTTCMKVSEGFSKVIPSILIFVFYGVSFALMTLSIRKLEVSVVYAIWAGLGTALIALIGIFIFQEKMTALKFVSLLLVVAGVIGLNLGAKVSPQDYNARNIHSHDEPVSHSNPVKLTEH